MSMSNSVKVIRCLSKVCKETILALPLKQNIQSRARLSTQSASSCFTTLPPMTSEVTCRQCEACDRDDMINFLIREFVRREPIMRETGCDGMNAREFLEYNVDEAIIQGASFLARNSNGKICGLRLNGIGEAFDTGDSDYFGKNASSVFKFCNFMEKGLAKKLGTQRFMRHVAICVEPSAVQCGVATELMQLSLEFAKRENLEKLTAMCSWKLPYKLAKKMGYQCIRKVPYSSYVDVLRNTCTDDVTPFENLAKNEVFATLMVGTVSK